MMRYSDERMRRSCHKFTLILNFLLCLASFMFSKAKTLRLTIKVLKRFEDTRNELSMIKFHAFLCSLCFGMHRRAVWRKNLSTRKPQISFKFPSILCRRKNIFSSLKVSPERNFNFSRCNSVQSSGAVPAYLKESTCAAFFAWIIWKLDFIENLLLATTNEASVVRLSARRLMITVYVARLTPLAINTSIVC